MAGVGQCEDALYMAANEPSIGLFRIYEHVERAVPAFSSRKVCVCVWVGVWVGRCGCGCVCLLVRVLIGSFRARGKEMCVRGSLVAACVCE